MSHSKEIIGDIPNGVKVFSKQLGKTDKNHQLIVPTNVLEQFPIQKGYYERNFTAFDEKGVKWNFMLAVRQTGEYDKPFLRPSKWHEFVRVHGLCEEDGDYGVVFFVNDQGKMQVRGLRRHPYTLLGQPIWQQV
uniref:TF-B3 domain-containing protein n=1 Tax=Manihot esculenta TaxID=3983 RepID=A0A2C9VHM3_MANES